MGTLGCINDMMRRDKENRELRRASRERLNETRNRLLDVKGKRSECNVSYEQLEHIAHETREWEEKERNSFLKGKLVFNSWRNFGIYLSFYQTVRFQCA